MSNPISRGTGTTHDRTWIESGSFWLKVTPFGFRKILKFIKEEYGNPPIYVTENGISERGPVDLNDIHRTHYYENYINQALKGIKRRIWSLRSVCQQILLCINVLSFSPCSGWSRSERLYSLVPDGQF